MLLTPKSLAGQAPGGGESVGPVLFAQLDWCGLRFPATSEHYCPLAIQRGHPGLRTGLSATPTSLYHFIGDDAPYTAGFTPLKSTCHRGPGGVVQDVTMPLRKSYAFNSEFTCLTSPSCSQVISG